MPPDAAACRLEAELTATPMDGLDLSLSASFLDAKYKDFQSDGDDYSGNTLPNAPETSINASARYEWAIFGGEASAQGDVAYRTKVYYDTRNVERLSDGDWAGLEAEARGLVAFLAGRDAEVYRRYGHWWGTLPAVEVRLLGG